MTPRETGNWVREGVPRPALGRTKTVTDTAPMNRLKTAAAALSLCLFASCGPSKIDQLADAMEDCVVLLEGVQTPEDASRARQELPGVTQNMLLKIKAAMEDGFKMEGEEAARMQQLQTRMQIARDRLAERRDLLEALGEELPSMR